MTLTDFLLARIAEDEYEANVCLDQYRRGDGGSTPRWVRQLAECEAKRRIIELETDGDGGWPDGFYEAQYLAMQWIAGVYADHPDYQQEWRP